MYKTCVNKLPCKKNLAKPPPTQHIVQSPTDEKDDDKIIITTNYSNKNSNDSTAMSITVVSNHDQHPIQTANNLPFY